MHVLRLPSLAENVVDATLIRWHAADGAPVDEGDRLAELVTEKATFDFEAVRAGTLTHRLAPPNSVLPVGYALALLDATDAEARAVRADNDALLARHAAALAGGLATPADGASPFTPEPSAPATVPAIAPASPPGGAVRATPAARRLAKELGVDLAAAAARHPGALLKEEHVRDAAAAG